MIKLMLSVIIVIAFCFAVVIVAACLMAIAGRAGK